MRALKVAASIGIRVVAHYAWFVAYQCDPDSQAR